MLSRQEKILEKIILDYIKTGAPVGSKKLAAFFNCSPATIRNEMAAMEKMGFITQPYTSAGRMPTELGYQHYISNYVKKTQLPEDQKAQLKSSLNQELTSPDSARFALKDLAKQMSDFSIQTVIIAFQDNDIFYTGISHLFSQPEFADSQEVCSISMLLDDLNSIVENVFDNVDSDVHIFVGQNNPLGNKCSALMTKYESGENEQGLLAILGPMRMPYDYNISLLEYCRDIINKSLT